MARLVKIIRVSRRNDREGESFMSPVEQDQTIDSYAEQHGHEIVNRYDETDSVSGKTTDREGLQAGMDEVLSDKADGIIVAKVDRFARNGIAGLAAVNQLREAGKIFIAVKDGIDGSTTGTPTGRMMVGFLFLIAQMVLETLTDGWEAVRHRHIANGVANHAKYGYRKDVVIGPDGRIIGGTRRLVPDDEGDNKAQWIEPIFERRAKGKSWADIADWLREEGAPGRWGVSSVKQIVESRVYLGEIRSGEYVNTKAHDPLVSVDLWTRANAVVTTNGERRDAEPYLLTGILRCASCGARMFGMTDRKKRAGGGGELVYRRYRCRGRHGAWGKCPAPVRIDADEIEALVDAEFRATFLVGKVAAPSGEASGAVEAAEAALAAAEAELDAFVITTAAIDADRFALGVNIRQERCDAARERLAEVRSEALGVALPAGLDEVWESYTIGERQPYIADAFNVVAVAKGREPAAERVRTWLTGDPNTPRQLPGIDGCNELTAIEV